MQLLIVDADPHLLAVLARVAQAMRPEWTVRSATSDEAALRLVEAAPVDAIACQVRGPGEEARALLARMRDGHPGAIRVALAGDEARRDGVALGFVAHRVLDRPCTGADLVATVERAHGLRTLLDDPVLRAAVGRMTTLPSPPGVLMDFENEVADPNTTMERLAAVIERDPGTSAAVLRMANISIFRRSQDATTVLDALRALGTQMVRGVVIGHAVASRLAACSGTIDLEAWQERAMSVATTARDLARRLARLELQREAFIAGLLHDVGTLVLACGAPATLDALRTRAREHGEDIVAAARAAELPPPSAVGAYLLALWGIPVAIVEAVAAWHDPATLPGEDIDAAFAVHVADALVDRPGFARRAVDPALLASRRRGAEVEAWIAAAGALRG